MKHIITVFFVFSVFNFFAQEIKLDEIDLIEKIKNTTNTEEKIDLLLVLAENQYEYDFTLSKKSIQNVFTLINSKKDNVSQKQLGKAYIIQAIVNRREGKYPEAIECNLKAKLIYEKLNDSLHISDIIHNMGMIYRSQKQHKKAINSYKQSIKIKKKINDYEGIAFGYNMMGVSFRQSNQLDSALINYNKARKLFDSIHSFENAQRVNNNLVAFYREQKKYDLALKLALENMAKSKKANKKLSLVTAYFNISTLYKKTKDYKLSLQYADSSLIIAKKENFRKRISQAYLRKSFLSHKLGDYKTAYFDYRKFNRHSDSIFNIENIKKIQALELNYKFQQEKREVELVLEQEATKKKLYKILFFVTFISGVIISYLLYRNYKNKSNILSEKIEKEKIQKELLDAKIKVNEEETKKIIADNTMRLEFKEEFLNQIKKELLPEASGNLKTKLNSLISELQLQINTENKFSDIQSKVGEVNKGFDTKLRELYPKLTKTEREICALLRLNLSIKEIMTVRNSSLDSVKSSRYRIRKKLGLKSGEELEKFIQNIS